MSVHGILACISSKLFWRSCKGSLQGLVLFSQCWRGDSVGNVLPQGISVDLRWWETGKEGQIHLNFLDKVIPEKLISNSVKNRALTSLNDTYKHIEPISFQFKNYPCMLLWVKQKPGELKKLEKWSNYYCP